MKTLVDWLSVEIIISFIPFIQKGHNSCIVDTIEGGNSGQSPVVVATIELLKLRGCEVKRSGGQETIRERVIEST